jgi:L-ascorbate metabolism protein UlaG (beta-lactamase superfamily)
MNLNHKKTPVSRRNFLALAGLSAAGLYLACSEQYVPKMLREMMVDASRAVLLPKHTPQPEKWDNNAITASWLGHSTVLMNFFGLTVLTDPVLFRRVGADLGVGTVGPKRLVAPALTPDQLPHIDLVLMSHAHMDHFDVPTVNQLPEITKAVTAKATGDLFSYTHIKDAKELAWGEKTTVKTRSGDIGVEAFEVKHWGARWRRDTYRGYNGYVLEREGKKVIFGGDTALTDTFRPLRGRGPYELAIMPIGAYQPWVCSHCTPEQSLGMANDAGAKYFLPIHHKTFKLGQEGPHEPIHRLEAALSKESERLALRDIGETFTTA